MSAPRWIPQIEINKRESLVMRRITRTGRLFAFLRLQRHAIFDDAFQDELGGMYRDNNEGKVPVPPALMAMATILQAYAGVSDAEAVDRATFDARWQMVLGVLGASEPPFSQGALVAFRERLIKYEMDRRLLERTVDFARTTKGFDYKKLPKSVRLAVDARPLSGAGRVEDSVNLLGRAGRHLLVAAATFADMEVDDLAASIDAGILLEPSIKAALDVDWTVPKHKAEALRTLLAAVESLERFVREQLGDLADAAPFSEHLATIARLRDQNIEPDPPDGGGPRVRQGVAPDRQVSISDPEMRHGRKSKSHRFNGYKIPVAGLLDDGLIAACGMEPANRPEREGLDAMADDIERVVGDIETIDELHIDRGFTGSRLTQRLAKTGTLVLSKPRTVQPNRGLFDKRYFKVDLQAKTATCPTGQVIPIEIGRTNRFSPDVCDICIRRAECTSAALGKARSLRIAHDEAMQHSFIELVSSSEGRARLRQRVAIEHMLARHARIMGRRARYRGVRKNLYDARRAAAVLNLECAHRNLALAA